MTPFFKGLLTGSGGALTLALGFGLAAPLLSQTALPLPQVAPAGPGATADCPPTFFGDADHSRSHDGAGERGHDEDDDWGAGGEDDEGGSAPAAPAQTQPSNPPANGLFAPQSGN